VSAFAELFQGVAAVLWPLAFGYLIYTFKGDVRRLIAGRVLKKGKLFGQEFELEAQLDQLQKKTEALPEAHTALPSLASKGEDRPAKLTDVEREVYDVTRQVLLEAGTSPKAALMSLAAQMEAELRDLLQKANAPVGPRTTWRDSVNFLRQRGVSADLLDSMIRFRDIRNRIIHGHEADDNNVLRALDLGLRILNAVRALPPSQS
jgi:uncharacterized protein YutE (UPF0331/DUF86 family)